MGINVYPEPATGGGGTESPVYSFTLTPNKKYTTTDCNNSATYYLTVTGNKGVEPNASYSVPTVYANVIVYPVSSSVPTTVQLEQDKPYSVVGTIASIEVIGCSNNAVLAITKADTVNPTSSDSYPSISSGSGNQISPMPFYITWAYFNYSQRKGTCYSYDDLFIYSMGRNGYLEKYELSINTSTTMAAIAPGGTADLEVAALFDTSGQNLYAIAANNSNSTWYFYTYNKLSNTWTQRLTWTDSSINSSSYANGGARYMGYDLAYNGYLVGTRFFMPDVLGNYYIETSTWTRTAQASNAVTNSVGRGQHTSLVNGKIYYSPAYNVELNGTWSSSTNQSIGVYTPSTNTWTNINYPSYSLLGGAVFRWSSTEVAFTGASPVRSNASNANSYASNSTPYVYVYNTVTAQWTSYDLSTSNYIPMHSYPGSVYYSYSIYQRATSTYDKTFSVYLSNIKGNSGYGYRGPVNAGTFVDFRGIGTNKYKTKILAQDIVRPLVLPGQKYCLAAGGTGFKNEEGTATSTYGDWGPWTSGSTNYGPYNTTGIVAVDVDGAFVKNIAPDVQVIAGCYDIVNGGAWYFYVLFTKSEVYPYSTSPSYVTTYPTRTGFIRVNEADLSVDVLFKGQAFGTTANPGVTGGVYYPQGLCWVYDGVMFLMGGSGAGPSNIDMYAYDMNTGQSVTFPYGSGTYSTVYVFSGDNNYLPIGNTNTTWYGPNYYRWSTWAGWAYGPNATSPDGSITTPIPMFWNGKDLWYPTTVSGTPSAYPIVSFSAGGWVGQRPPSVYKDPVSGRLTCETSTGFVQFDPVNYSSKPAYVFAANAYSGKLIKAQAYRGTSGGGTYANQWSNTDYDFNGKEYSLNSNLYGSITPKTMMGNVQLNFGSLTFFYCVTPSATYVAYIDKNITRMVV